MMNIAIYGKGGIGKSTISANITAALADSGKKVLQIGCDPKHDSTRLLLNGRGVETLLEYLRITPPEDRRIEDVIVEGYGGCLCAECGGPEPGIGCAGRGIITSLDFIFQSGLGNIERDITIYDVLGDVVCGGFAVPLRNEYANVVFVISSGEYMSIYAANNILRGICNYDSNKVGGIIFNSRGDPEEENTIRRFSDAVGIPIVASFERSGLFKSSEQNGKTVVEMYPDSEIAGKFRTLADLIMERRTHSPKPLTDDELEESVLGRSISPIAKKSKRIRIAVTDNYRKKYLSRNVSKNETYYGCAFSGACTTCASVSGLHVILHSPTSCAQLTFQSISSTYGRYGNDVRIGSYCDPRVECTHMREEDAIFGGIERLRNKLESSIRDGNDNIAVITSCASGIIGDDVLNVIDETKMNNPGVNIIPISVDGCLTGDFIQGVIDATIALIDGFSEKTDVTDSVNIVGTKPLALNTLNSVERIVSLLNELDIGVNCILPGCDSVRSFKHVGSAKMNLLMNPDVFSIQISTFLDERFGMSTSPVPVRPGICGTLSWMRELSVLFGRRYDFDSLRERLYDEFDHTVGNLKKTVKGKNVTILSASRDIDWIIEAIERVGMKRLRTVIVDRSDYGNDMGATNQFENAIYVDSIDIKDELGKIRTGNPDLVISTVRICDDIPSVIIPLVPEPDPMAGAEFVRKIALTLMSSESEGWRKDVVRS